MPIIYLFIKHTSNEIMQCNTINKLNEMKNSIWTEQIIIPWKR